MCLAVPMKVIEINGDMGIVESKGVKMEAGLSLIEDVKLNDWVIVHAGFAISKLNKEDAEKSLELFEEMSRLANKKNG